MVWLHLMTMATAVVGANETVLLDFTASWCGPCKAMEPVVQRLVAEGKPVQKVDFDQRRDLAGRFGVDKIPCFVMLVNGREVDRVVGPASYERLSSMLAKIPTPTAASAPSKDPFTKSQSKQAAASNSCEDAALRATVRLKVEDAQGFSYGTGTIIDVHSNESLVLTCGHIFRDSQGQGKISVEVFLDGQAHAVPGQLISYDLKRDIGLVSIRPGVFLEPARLAGPQQQFAPGAAVFSVGCDRGADPTVRRAKVTSVNRYQGPPNIEASGAPVQGRSGGGLFTADGMLIGVCKLADEIEQEGIYSSHVTIREALSSAGLAGLFESKAASPAPAPVELAQQPEAPRRPSSTPSRAHARPAGFDYTKRSQAAPSVEPARAAMQPAATDVGWADEPVRAAEPVRADEPVRAESLGSQPVSATAATMAPRYVSQFSDEDTELICIVRSKSNPSGDRRTYVVDRPSRRLLEQLSQSASPVEPGGDSPYAKGLREADLREMPAVRAQSPQ